MTKAEEFKRNLGNLESRFRGLETILTENEFRSSKFEDAYDKIRELERELGMLMSKIDAHVSRMQKRKDSNSDQILIAENAFYTALVLKDEVNPLVGGARSFQ